MDLSQSVIADIKRTFKNDGEAEEYLRALGQDNKPSDDEIERILRVEFAEFKKLGRDCLLDVLTKNKYDFSSCYGTLISLLETKDWQEKRAHNILENLKQKLTSSEIQRAIDDNDGDVEKTAAQLLEKGRDQDEKTRDSILENLVARFRDLKLPLILQLLNENNWNIQVIVPKLVMQRRNNLAEKLYLEFPSLEKEQIYYAIEANDNETHDKTRENLQQLIKEKEFKTASDKQNKKDLLAESIVELVSEVKKDIDNVQDYGINVNFTSMFDNYVRAEAKLPGNVHEDTDSKGALGSSQFQSQILDNREKQENPVTSDPGLTVLAKHLDGSKHIIKFEVPDRVDFGDKIIVHWSHTGTPHENDWVAMYAEGKSGSDYYSYQWVTPGPDRVPFAFDTPYSAANNFYFCYYSNKSYVLCAESSVVKIGPKYSIDFASCNENKNNPTNLFTVGLKIKQEGGKSQPNLWIALYPENERNLKQYVSYQYCAADKDIKIEVPKSGSWAFKLFPFKSYEPILSVAYFIPGEDEVTLSVVGSHFVIAYNVKTLSSAQKPWIGIYEASEERPSQWKRYKYVDNAKGAMTIDANVPPGRYEARLLDIKATQVFAKSQTIAIES